MKMQRHETPRTVAALAGLGITAALLLTPAASFAGDLPKGLSGYELEGSRTACVSTRSIQRTTALDDRNILFVMSGKKKYLNRLRGKCARLASQDSFAYKTVGGRLCSGEIITVLHNGEPGSSCSLGTFQRLVKKEAEKTEGQ